MMQDDGPAVGSLRLAQFARGAKPSRSPADVQSAETFIKSNPLRAQRRHEALATQAESILIELKTHFVITRQTIRHRVGEGA